MQRLALRVELHDGESVMSFLSRLASMNAAPSARQFCQHVGLNHQRIVDGDTEELCKLADLSEAPATQLQHQAIVRDEAGFAVRGERLVRNSLRRDRLFVCAACLENDLRNGGDVTAAFGRLTWQITHIRSCQCHRQLLSEVHSDADLHDFTVRLSPLLSPVRRLEAETELVGASKFEDYVRARIEGSGEPGWLADLELHAALRICEVLGAVANRGIWPGMKTFGLRDWFDASNAGFAIVSEGVSGIRSFLGDLQQARAQEASTSHDGPQAAFGYLFDWASRGLRHPAYEPLRDVMFAHIVETMQVAPGEVLLGRRVERRVLHSVRSASLEHEIHPKRLRKILGTSYAPGERDQIAGETFFDAVKVEHLLNALKQSLSLKEAREYLGADRVQTNLLHRAGFITSVSSTGGRLAFAKAEMDDFLRKLADATELVSTAPLAADTIPAAARKANAGAMEIVGMIMERQLTWVGRLEGVHGYLGLLVDVREVRLRLRGPELDGLPAYKVAKTLKASGIVIDALIKHGVLPVETAINPINRCPVEIVRTSEIEKFRATYVSIAELSRTAGTRPIEMRELLEDEGVKPELSKELFKTEFYRRSDFIV